MRLHFHHATPSQARERDFRFVSSRAAVDLNTLALPQNLIGLARLLVDKVSISQEQARRESAEN